MIKILPNDTINKIAAGEIIERPASVIKELIENSLDAGADEIIVEIKASGKNLIRVIDNGSGMGKDDAVLCIERHATSKIEKSEDLDGISTFGFRGEALPSIGSVSKLTIITKSKENDVAARVRVEGGNLIEVKDTGASSGTMVEVQNLFFNTPARRKFLKTNLTEFSHIVKIISNYALINIQCGFKLINDGETIIDINKKDELMDRIKILYGSETAENIVPLSYVKEYVKVSGFVSSPVYTKPNRTSQFIFVNKRPVFNKSISYGIYDGYASLIPSGRFPVIFLFIYVPPGTLDVNVHPAKSEVRFHDDRLIKDAVSDAVLNALAGREQPIKNIDVGDTDNARTNYSKPAGFPVSYNVKTEYAQNEWGGQLMEQGEAQKIVQMNDSYLILEQEDGFEIIDQHAMHERILYEKIKIDLANKQSIGQRLLLPLTIELSANEEALINDKLEFFKELGFSIEEFGRKTIAVDMVPAVLAGTDIEQLLKDIVSGLKETEKDVSLSKAKDDIIKIIACRAAVKQGDRLDYIEMKRLISEWKKIDLPYTCPHGRPCAVKMTKEELDKRFHRT